MEIYHLTIKNVYPDVRFLPKGKAIFIEYLRNTFS